MPEQPDDLVTALAQVMESTMFAGSPDPSPNARWQWSRLARAVLARTDLVLPAAHVIPKQTVRDLVERWGRSGGPWWTHEQMRETHIAEVRALLAEEVNGYCVCDNPTRPDRDCGIPAHRALAAGEL